MSSSPKKKNNNKMASLERSLQFLSINDIKKTSKGITAEQPYAGGKQSSSAASGNVDLISLELHSQTPLPYFWEQCLDLKTGEIYYINWRTGLRYDEDPRANPEILNDTDYYNSEDDDDSCSYDSEGYSSSYSDQSSPPSVVSNEKNLYQFKINGTGGGELEEEENVLVVTGCKCCLMYFMVPKKVEECPKCCGQLLHFDR